MAAKAAVEALPAAVARLAQRGSTASWYLLIAVEEAAEWIQVFKRPLPRIQFLHIPAECMVDENTTYSAFCTKPTGRCFMVRLDIQRTKITKQMMNTLEPIPGPDFIQQQMAEGVMYDDAADILEAPTTIGRMLFDPLNCIMHARVQAASAQHIFIFHNPLDHSLRVDARRLPELRAEPC